MSIVAIVKDAASKMGAELNQDQIIAISENAMDEILRGVARHGRSALDRYYKEKIAEEVLHGK